MQLLHGGGSLYIGCYQQRIAALFAKVQCDFAGMGGFARTLQAHHHQDLRTAIRVEQGYLLFAENALQFVVHNRDHALARSEALRHLFSLGAFFHGSHEILGYLEVHISFEQRATNIAHRIVDVFLRQLCAATELAKGLIEAIRKCLKHGLESFAFAKEE